MTALFRLAFAATERQEQRKALFQQRTRRLREDTFRFTEGLVAEMNRAYGSGLSMERTPVVSHEGVCSFVLRFPEGADQTHHFALVAGKETKRIGDRYEPIDDRIEVSLYAHCPYNSVTISRHLSTTGLNDKLAEKVKRDIAEWGAEGTFKPQPAKPVRPAFVRKTGAPLGLAA